MPDSPTARWITLALGALLVVAGVSVFLVRFQHEGPYAFPAGGSLRGALAALGLGGFLLLEARRARDGEKGQTPHPLRALLFATCPLVLFFALYATLAEVEEVIVLKTSPAEDPLVGSGRTANLRLWVVDHDGVEWVTMPRSKAEAHDLVGATLERLRDGKLRCVRVNANVDPETSRTIHQLRQERYAIARLATRIGIFSEGVDPNSMTLRLDPCAADPDGGA